jgi:hypothetical protein
LNDASLAFDALDDELREEWHGRATCDASALAEVVARRALCGFLLTGLMMLQSMKLLVGERWWRDIVDAVVLGDGGTCACNALASACWSGGRRVEAPARLMRGLRTLRAMGDGGDGIGLGA